MKKDVNMLSGSIMKGLLAISVPIMIMNVVQSLFNIVDMTVLKNFGDDEFAVGAVGACSTLITLINGIMIGCSAGSNVVVARHIGSSDKERARRAVGTSMFFSLIGGIAISFICFIFAELFLEWMNCPRELLPKAIVYFRLYVTGIPIITVYNFSAAILRSTGDSRRPMIYLTASGFIKAILNIILVAFFKMSVEGVAIATIVSWIICCALGARAIITNKNEMVRLDLSLVRYDKRELFSILQIGVPDALQRSLYSFANVIIATTVNSFGPEATTGISIANNFDGILYNIVTAPALAVMPYVSQNFGARNSSRVKRSVIYSIYIAVGLGLVFGELSAIFSGSLASIMSGDSLTIEYARQKMIIISSTYFICGINDILGSALRGLKKPMVPTVASFIYSFVFRFIWVYLIFPLCRNLTFLYLVWPISWVLSIITLLFFYIPTIRGLKREQNIS